MPTYVVSTVSGRLTAYVKQEIASRITESHGDATGAPSFFAQVILMRCLMAAASSVGAH